MWDAILVCLFGVVLYVIRALKRLCLEPFNEYCSHGRVRMVRHLRRSMVDGWIIHHWDTELVIEPEEDEEKTE